MPTFSTIQLKNLIDARLSSKRILQSDLISTTTPAGQEIKAEEDADANRGPVSTKHLYISPGLYTTPEPAPILEAPSSPTRSPYVVNHKGRGGWGGAIVNRRNNGGEIVPEESGFSETVIGNLEGDGMRGQGMENVVEGEDGGNQEEEDAFLDSRCESMSVGSACGSIGHFDTRSFVSTQGEYFDAIEDFSSDGSVRSTSLYTQSLESELCAVRLSLFEEMDRRKNAEETVNLMQKRWQKMGNLLREAKLTSASSSSAKEVLHCEDASLEEVAQEVIVCKYVGEEIAKGLARAEAELEAEAILESKDREISRLRDKLLYYEAVNREMSQRNQEIVENTRQQRLRNNAYKKWFWSCIGLSIVAGISVVAYSYLPESNKNHHQEFPNDLSDDASSSPSKAD